MSKRFTILTVALSSSVAFLVGLILAGGVSQAPVLSSAPAVPPSPVRVVRAVDPVAIPSVVNFADVAERINPAVVNIDATSAANPRASQRYYRRGDPLDGERDEEAPTQGAGSGFIIDKEGFILTNNHVIEGAGRITVTLADGRAFRAEVVGADPAIDVALIRISGARNLPEAAIGNSDELRVGEWVCAIGNPLGYVHSVTVGVVSFVGRKLFDPSLDDYIQTDAAINFGNSGGPLINSRGEVIGINSAISSRASNIGFAVPINQAVNILSQLKTKGRVSRGFIGIMLTDVTPVLQRALGLSVSEGVIVQEVTPSSPAERAGLKPYDVVLEVEGRRVISNDDLIRDISDRQPGSVARLRILRDGRRQVVPVKLAERPGRVGEGDGTNGDAADSQQSGRAIAPRLGPLGVSVGDMDRNGAADDLQGVVVTRVDAAGPAHQVLRTGIVILEINRRATRSVLEYQRVVGAFKPGDVVAIYYYDPKLAQRGLVTLTLD